MGFLHKLAGHLWTLLGPLKDAVKRTPKPGGKPLSCRIDDPTVGEITLRAVHYEAAKASSVIVMVHGIGGNLRSPYMLKAAAIVNSMGLGVVCVSLRGAEGDGSDISHAGLTDDLRAILTHPALRIYKKVFLMGYSLGGLTAIHAAANRLDQRLARVIAICPPLDLRAAMENFDGVRFCLHKLFMNAEANRQYAAVIKRGRGHCSIRELKRARTCAEWYDLTVVRRFGFQNAEHYYRSLDVRNIWRRFKVPVLIMAAQHDPIVRAEWIRQYVENAPNHIEIRWLEKGGHLFFPAALQLERQCANWVKIVAGQNAQLRRTG
jgi:predicted alpha/beta-fold hydrolase